MAKVAKRSEQRQEQRRWNGILRRERLSMDRGRPNKLTYVNPVDLANVPDMASDPEKILLAREKVKLIEIGYKKGDYWITKRVKVKTTISPSLVG